MCCQHWTQENERHLIQQVPEKADISYLQQLFDNGLPAQTEECNVVEPQLCRIKKCGKGFFNSFLSYFKLVVNLF